jgi:hypothetical protein
MLARHNGAEGSAPGTSGACNIPHPVGGVPSEERATPLWMRRPKVYLLPSRIARARKLAESEPVDSGLSRPSAPATCHHPWSA